MSALMKITVVESKLFMRDVTAAVITFLLPIGLLIVFGSINAGDGSTDDNNVSPAFLPAMALSLSAAMLGFSVLPTVLATYREKGILRRMATTPVHPGNVLTAQLLVNLAVAVLAGLAVLIISVAAFDVGMPDNIVGFLLAFVLMAAALFAIGLLVSAVAKTGKAATSIGMLLFFPSLFFAGIWTPGDLMPEWARPIRDVSPMGAGMESMQEAWTGGWPAPVSVLALLAVAAAAGFAAAKLFRWE